LKEEKVEGKKIIVLDTGIDMDEISLSFGCCSGAVSPLKPGDD